MSQRNLKLPQYTLGQRLEIAMKARGVKAPTLAGRTGLTRQGVYKILKDQVTNPDSDVVMDLCEELRVRPEWLLRERGPMYPSPELSDDESMLVYAFRDLAPDDRRKLLRIATTLATESEGAPNVNNPFRRADGE